MMKNASRVAAMIAVLVSPLAPATELPSDLATAVKAYDQAQIHGDRAELEEIDEVRVSAESGIGADRIGSDFGQRDDVRNCRDHQDVDVPPDARGLTRELGKLVAAFKGFDRRKAAAAWSSSACTSTFETVDF